MSKSADEGPSACSTSGRSASQSAGHGRCPALEGLYSDSGVGTELVRLWHGSPEEFSAAFQLGELVGEGGFAVVRKGRCPETGEDVAVKIVDRLQYGAQHNQNLDREIAILQQLDHPYLVRLKRVYLSSPRVYIVTELLTGGELLEQLTTHGRYPEAVARRMMRQLLQAVEYLHSRGIAHRDLKLENLLLATPAPDAPIKIADFGLSKLFLEDPLRTVCGSPQYVAPEVLTVGLLRASYGCAADLWSLGVVLFIMLAGYSPFDDDTEARMFERIRVGQYSVEGPLWEDVSGPARDLVCGLLCVDPAKRLTAARALQHSWLSSPQQPSSSAAPGVSPRETRPKMSPRRPTLKQLDKPVLQSRSPNQSAPESPRNSPRNEAASACPGSPSKAEPATATASSSPRSKAGLPRERSEGERLRDGSPNRAPASPRAIPASSPLGRPTSATPSSPEGRKAAVLPTSLLGQIGKLLR